MYGTEPVIKVVNGREGKYCETCGREIKLIVPGEGDPQSMKETNRCQQHNGDVTLEPCYYCHLQKHHLNLKPQKSS